MVIRNNKDLKLIKCKAFKGDKLIFNMQPGISIPRDSTKTKGWNIDKLEINMNITSYNEITNAISFLQSLTHSFRTPLINENIIYMPFIPRTNPCHEIALTFEPTHPIN